MPTSYLPFMVSFAVLMTAGFLSADELTLSDGRVLDGEIISAADAEMVEIRVGAAGLSAVQRFARAQVVKQVYGDSPAQRAQKALAARRATLMAVPDVDAAAWWQLANDARTAANMSLAREAAMAVIARDRQHDGARRLLGQTRCNGVWMRANEAATARGQVWDDGAWITWNERQHRLAEAARMRAEAAESRRRFFASQSGVNVSVEPSVSVFTYGQGYVWPSGVVPYGRYWSAGGCPVGGIGGGYAGSGSTCNNGSNGFIAASGGGNSTRWAFRWGF